MPTTSPKFTLKTLDFLKGLAVAALSQPILIILTSLAAGHFSINWTEQWHLAVSSGAAYLIKNFFSGPTPPTAGGNSVGIKTAIIFLVGMSLASCLCAQSIFKPLPKPASDTKSVNAFSRAAVPTTGGDSVFVGFRLTGLTVLYGVSNGYTASNVFAGTGGGIEHDTYSASSQRWYTDWQIGVGFYAGGHVAPMNLQAATAVGLHLALLNKQLILGILYVLNSPTGMNSHFVGAIGGNAYLIPTN